MIKVQNNQYVFLLLNFNFLHILAFLYLQFFDNDNNFNNKTPYLKLKMRPLAIGIKWKKKMNLLSPKFTKEINNPSISIYGSDSIWHYFPYLGFEPYYFGEKNEGFKIVYGASMGPTDINQFSDSEKKKINGNDKKLTNGLMLAQSGLKIAQCFKTPKTGLQRPPKVLHMASGGLERGKQVAPTAARTTFFLVEVLGFVGACEPQDNLNIASRWPQHLHF